MGARGPLPNPDKVRRNAPTIPTTSLPATGREAPVPAAPFGYDLRAAGAAWWAWAWAQPQACGWSDGDTYVLARRAALEDDLAALEAVRGLDVADLDDEWRATIGRIASLATGRLALMKEMRELDDRLGLSPKGLAALRWKIVDVAAEDKAPKDGKRYGHLRSA